MLNFMSTNSPLTKFPSKPDAEKLQHLSSALPPLSPDPPLLRVICSPPLLPTAAPLSLTPPLLSPLPLSCPQPLCVSSPRLSTSSVLSSLLSAPSLPFRLSDLRCGSRGLIYSPNMVNRTRANALKGREKKNHAHSSHRPDPKCILGYIQPARIKTRAKLATCTFATDLHWSVFSTPSLRLTLSYRFTDSMDFSSTQS